MLKPAPRAALSEVLQQPYELDEVPEFKMEFKGVFLFVFESI